MSKSDTYLQKLCQKMQYLNTQQLSSYSKDNRKLDDSFLMFATEDLKWLSEYQFIGSRSMIFVCKGTFELIINGSSRIMHEYDYSDILDGTMFHFGEISSDAEVYCIFTSKPFILDSMQGVFPEHENYLSRILSNPVMSFGDSRRRDDIGMQIKLLYGMVSDVSHKYRAEMVKLYFKALVLDLSSAMSETSGQSIEFRKAGRKESLIASFVESVWRHLHETREVSFYARELCITHKHLSRVVKEVTGKTPHEIIAGETLAMALQLLQNDRRLVQQVADMLHFSDQAAFSKFFKKYVGMSPAEYRKTYDESRPLKGR